VSNVLQDFSEGNLEATSRNLDLGISGQGFFRFEQAGQVVYSRNGQLTMTSDGYLQNAQGARLMGFGVNAAGGVQGGGQPEVLRVASDEMPASATTQVSATLNLDSREVAGEGLDSVELEDGAGNLAQVSYHYANNFTLYDSLGNPHNTSVYYQKTANNSWDATVAIDGVLASAGPTPLTFDANGQLTTPAALQVTDFDPDTGAAPLNVDMDISSFSQFGNNSTASELTQNGYTSGTLVGIAIENDGTVVRNYSNEQSRAAGQIVMANFRNPEGLNPEGDNVWAATAASGQELVGPPGTGLLGTIESGAIETSNVDMARELVNMIVTQRAYQANSQTIKTQDEVLQTAINLR